MYHGGRGTEGRRPGPEIEHGRGAGVGGGEGSPCNIVECRSDPGGWPPLHPEGVTRRSPVSRSAPWESGDGPANESRNGPVNRPGELACECNVRRVAKWTEESAEKWIVGRVGESAGSPGCASRPWASLCNPFGVKSVNAGPHHRDCVPRGQAKNERGRRNIVPPPSSEVQSRGRRPLCLTGCPSWPPRASESAPRAARCRTAS